jgi:anion-transporting  ArsA/GET3 family ATPase
VVAGVHTRSYSHASGRFLRKRPPYAASVLLDRRLIFVTGKGGVGKSTVSMALGLLAARRGLRTIVAELASQERVQRTFEHREGQFREVELAPGLFTISIDPQHAMEEYLRVKSGRLGEALGSSRLFHAFAMATPGMRELLSIGKVWELAQFERRTREASPYDLVIVDAPATGHGVAILRTPRTFAEIAKVGPIAHQGRTIAQTIYDRDFTAVLAVSTAEEMPINETLALRSQLRREGLRLEAVILNALYPERFAEPEIERLRHALENGDGSAAARGAVKAALSEHARQATQREQCERLSSGAALPIVELPYLFAEQLGPDELEQLADVLEEGLAT